MSRIRRTRIELIRDVLRVMEDEECVKKTEIVYHANLNFNRATGMLNWMMEHDLIEEVAHTYHLTEKGKEFLDRFSHLGILVDTEYH
jgi:predicted transcriptional regulator